MTHMFPEQIKDWHLYIRHFKSPRQFQIIFQIIDLQGDGEIILTIGLLKNSIQFKMPFPGHKIKTRCSWWLFKSKLR